MQVDRQRLGAEVAITGGVFDCAKSTKDAARWPHGESQVPVQLTDAISFAFAWQLAQCGEQLSDVCVHIGGLADD